MCVCVLVAEWVGGWGVRMGTVKSVKLDAMTVTKCL